MKAKLIKENLNESTYELKVGDHKVFDTTNKSALLSYLKGLKQERPGYFERSRIFVDNIEISKEQFIFINKHSDESEANILIDIFKKVKKLLPNIRIYVSNKGAILIPYKNINDKQKDKLFKEFDVESDKFFITDDAGPDGDCVGIFVANDENMEEYD